MVLLPLGAFEAPSEHSKIVACKRTIAKRRFISKKTDRIINMQNYCNWKEKSSNHNDVRTTCTGIKTRLIKLSC